LILHILLIKQFYFRRIAIILLIISLKQFISPSMRKLKRGSVDFTDCKNRGYIYFPVNLCLNHNLYIALHFTKNGSDEYLCKYT